MQNEKRDYLRAGDKVKLAPHFQSDVIMEIIYFTEDDRAMCLMKYDDDDFRTYVHAGNLVRIEDTTEVVGRPGLRDPDAPCGAFEPGKPGGSCYSDGHYLCAKCSELDPAREVWR